MDDNNWRWIKNCRDVRKIGEAIIVFMTSILPKYMEICQSTGQL